MPTRDQLAHVLRAIEHRIASASAHADAADDAIAALDWLPHAAAPSLRRGGLHEWLGVADPASSSSGDRPSPWMPALAITTHLAIRALRSDVRASGVAVWIGRRSWPYPHLLARAGSSLLERCLFVDPPDAGARVWAIDLALRSPAASVVIADASGLDMASSRRLQLAAEAGAIAANRTGSMGGLGLLLRPWREMSNLSAAWTRWLIRREPSVGNWPRWRIELLRNRSAGGAIAIGARTRDAGAMIDRGGTNAWIVELDRADAGVVIPAGMAGRTGETPRPSIGAGPRLDRLIA